MSPFKLFILLFILFPVKIFSQVFEQKDIDIFHSKIELAKINNYQNLTLNQVIELIGKSFISTPYLPNPLEITEEENLVINLRGLDCTTFLETSFAIALCIKNNKTTFNDFQYYLKKIRYRNGIITDYTSRLHYFSDWIYDNKKKNLITDLTKDLGGIDINFNLNYMSSNYNLYKHLKNNTQFIPIIKEQEKNISKRIYSFIPTNKISKILKKIKSGDFIAITTNIKGLDISHVGIAVKRENNKTYFLHAPSVGKFVEITEKPLDEYIKSNKKNTGIIVLRAVEE